MDGIYAGKWAICSTALQSEGTQKLNTVQQSFLQYAKTSSSQVMSSSCLFLSVHSSHWLDEKPGLLHTLISGLKYWLLQRTGGFWQRTGGFWQSSALNSFTSPPLAPAGSDHVLVSPSRIVWKHDPSQALQAVLALHSRPSFLSASVQKEVSVSLEK